LQVSRSRLLKKDVFGTIEAVSGPGGRYVRRDCGNTLPIARWIARRLLAREAAALAAADGVAGVPALLRRERDVLDREFIDGRPMQEGRPGDPDYFRQAAWIVRKLHRHGIVHNDLAKEPNFLVTPDGRPAIVDFQLSWCRSDRGRLFRILAHEDIRHLLKHKRQYCPAALTAREIAILASPSLLTQVWRRTVKPVYLFVTRRLMGWRDREGAGDRFRSDR